jgi:hypothetical protein
MAIKSRAGVIVDVVLDDMEGRSGFDGWWSDIDEDTRREIRMELAEKVEAILKRKLFDPDQPSERTAP